MEGPDQSIETCTLPEPKRRVLEGSAGYMERTPMEGPGEDERRSRGTWRAVVL